MFFLYFFQRAILSCMHQRVQIKFKHCPPWSRSGFMERCVYQHHHNRHLQLRLHHPRPCQHRDNAAREDAAGIHSVPVPIFSCLCFSLRPHWAIISSSVCKTSLICVSCLTSARGWKYGGYVLQLQNWQNQLDWENWKNQQNWKNWKNL